MSRVEIYTKGRDIRGEFMKKNFLDDLGINSEKVITAEVYTIFGISEQQMKTTISELFFEPLVNECHTKSKKFEGCWVLEVSYKKGVQDPVELSALKALMDIGIEAKSVKTSQKFAIKGISESDAKKIGKFLANEVIQDCEIGYESVKHSIDDYKGAKNDNIATVDILDSSDYELIEISKKGFLSLNLEEMKAVQEHFKKIGRNPTDGELEAIAQTWSEHCKHKVFNSEFDYVENGKHEHVPNMFKTFIVAATRSIKKDWLVSVFSDNAGIIKFDDKFNVAFKVETHNHPSALDPYGGAGTGIGGVIRDVLGAGLGAKPILNTDVFCFAPPNYSGTIPDKILHPKRIMKGVVSAVRDYGNRMGIPTVNGAIIFHDDFLGAPLVYCGTAGIIPAGMEQKEVNDGDLLVVFGGKTGRDGIHGATFSSEVLDESSPTSAVQIGNAIEEKNFLDALLQARDENLYTCLTDVGGGGFSSAIGEMGKDTGVEVYLEKVPLKYEGMTPWEIWVSESQERMVFSVPQKNLSRFMELCEQEGTHAFVIGKFTNTKKLVVKYGEKMLIDLDMHFLHDGLPKTKKKATWNTPNLKEPEISEPINYDDVLKSILSHPSVASKEWVIRQYDHEVQAATVIKPLVGIQNDGPGDAAVVKPLYDSWKGVVVGCGINPRYSAIDTYWMAASAIDESLRNIVAVGGNFNHTAILDNFCWGGVSDEKALGNLLRAVKSCHDFSLLFQTPFISGKDSLRNEYVIGGKRIGIPDTLLISAISVNEDIRKCVTMDAKEVGNSIYIVGKTFDELGGSHYYAIHDEIGANVPKVREEAKVIFEKMSGAIQSGLVRSCHDCSEGGIGIAAAEMSFAGGVGMRVELSKVPYEGRSRNDLVLFSESNSRFVVEVEKGKQQQFEKAMSGVEFAKIGELTSNSRLSIIGLESTEIMDSDINELKAAWKGTFKW